MAAATDTCAMVQPLGQPHSYVLVVRLLLSAHTGLGRSCQRNMVGPHQCPHATHCPSEPSHQHIIMLLVIPNGFAPCTLFVLQAEVQGKNQDGSIQLHTRSSKFGKVRDRALESCTVCSSSRSTGSTGVDVSSRPCFECPPSQAGHNFCDTGCRPVAHAAKLACGCPDAPVVILGS
jgi:hypothetical protein